jgi:HSP20 family protein
MADKVPAKRQNREANMMRQRDNPFLQWRDAFFDRFFNGWPLMPSEEQQDWPIRTWGLDLDERDDRVRVRAELPGFEPQDLDVQINDDVLTIRAEKKQESEQEQEYRSFRRTITLPRGIDPEKVEASYRNGVLTLEMPKAAEARARRIQIQGEKGQPSKRLESQTSQQSETRSQENEPARQESGKTKQSAKG